MCGVYVVCPVYMGITSSDTRELRGLVNRKGYDATTPISCISMNSGVGLWLSFVYAVVRSGADYPVSCYGLQLEGRYLVMSGVPWLVVMKVELLQAQEIEPP